MLELAPEDILAALKHRGARRLKRVALRGNRSTIWSLTQGGTVLNLHEAYRFAPDAVLAAFALIVKKGGRRCAEVSEAQRVVREWPGLRPGLEAARSAKHSLRHRGCAGPGESVAYCCGTPRQRAYIRALYRYLNETRFEGALPDDVPVRLSSRMTSRLGHMTPGFTRQRGRFVVEIALNVDLMLEGNGFERLDTLLHEMAHAADYLTDGGLSHDEGWQAWARRVGCRAESRYERPVVRRRRRSDPVTRVPPLPPALRERMSLWRKTA